MTIQTWDKLPPWKLWMSYDREAEVSSYNAMSACKSTLESSGVGVQFDAYDMV